MDPIFKDLFEYSHKTNQKLITRLTEQGRSVPENAIRLINHVINAQHIWNSRIVKAESNAGVWYIHNTDDLARIDGFNFEDSISILKKQKLDERIEYMTSKGDIYTTTVRDILFHVINHSTYHRAQIAMELRQAGLEPVNTDFIFYKREQEVFK